jgi:transcriptional regulator with XRE-family HTH domain
MEIGGKIRFLRLLRGQTQQELCYDIGTGPPYLARYEKGTSEPKKEMTLRLAQALGVNVEWLLYSTKAPFVFYIGMPISQETPIRHGNTIIAGLNVLLPQFLAESSIEACLRVSLAGSDCYLFAIHALDFSGQAVQDGSVLLVMATPAVKDIIDQSLQGKGITAQEISLGHIDGSRPIQSVLEDAEIFLRPLLKRARATGPAWLDVEQCIAAWRQHQNDEGRRSIWILPVSLTLESHEKITREEALAIVAKVINDATTRLPKGYFLRK